MKIREKDRQMLDSLVSRTITVRSLTASIAEMTAQRDELSAQLEEEMGDNIVLHLAVERLADSSDETVSTPSTLAPTPSRRGRGRKAAADNAGSDASDQSKVSAAGGSAQGQGDSKGSGSEDAGGQSVIVSGAAASNGAREEVAEKKPSPVTGKASVIDGDPRGDILPPSGNVHDDLALEDVVRPTDPQFHEKVAASTLLTDPDDDIPDFMKTALPPGSSPM